MALNVCFQMFKLKSFYFGGKPKGDLQASHLLTTDFKFWSMAFAVGSMSSMSN